MNANKIHYAKTLDNIYNTDWNDWIEMHKNNDIDVVYNSFHSLFQSKIVLETRKANRKKPIQPWMTYEILGKKRKMDIDRKRFLKNRKESNEIKYKTSKKDYNRDINPILPGGGGQKAPDHHGSFCRVRRARAGFTKILDFVPFNI